jgi:WD40 repeat protein
MRDGKRFASCDSAGKVYIQALDGTVLQEFEGHVQTVYGIALSPDEQRLATASTDGTVRVWDVESGAELLTLTGTGKTFYSVAFSPDGGLLAATADNGTLWIWDGRREAPLELAEVKKADLVYDLGSGDGRIVIAAARLGSTAVGVEWDKDLVKESLAKAKEAGVEKLATFEHGDLFEADFSKADVVAVYILPTMLKKLTPKLNKLKAGSRIVSHAFAIPGVKPARVVEFTSEEDDISRKLYLYTVPLVEDKR